MVPRFAIAQLRRVLEVAAGAEEACGLLLGGAEVEVVPARNVSPNPRDSFEIDPAALLAVHRAARAGGAALLGCWHTHPRGDPSPSMRDAQDAAPDGRLWLIATAREARLWRAGPTGAVHGRFDPVRFDVAEAPGEGVIGGRVVKRAIAVQRCGPGRGLVVVPGVGEVP